MSSQQLEQKIEFLSQEQHKSSVCGIVRGIERETLRVHPDGSISQGAHPKVLGSALTHPYITTDFSEALLEFITPASRCVDTTVNQLADIHHYVANNIGDEYLWPLSMPCYIPSEDDIKLANYGTSNVGQMKHLYRRGLKFRYGSTMQAISGIHFNLSFPTKLMDSLANFEGLETSSQDHQSSQYLGLIRNFKRNVWLLTYLFGASPALCGSFLNEQQKAKYPFKEVGQGSLYLPYATSLRLSDLGYTSNEQSSLNISYDNLPDYIKGLRRAIQTPVDSYVIPPELEDTHAQLNNNILQIENEFYSPIRPKRTAASNEKPTDALESRGIEYIEMRSVDINPYSPVGIDKTQIYFLDVFAAYCLLKESPDMGAQEQSIANSNLEEVILRGRDPELKLGVYNHQSGEVEQVGLAQLGEQVFAELKLVADYLDKVSNSDIYAKNVAEHLTWVQDSSKTLSARYLNELLENNIGSGRWGKAKAAENKAALQAHQVKLFDTAHMQEKSAESLDKQVEIEKADKVDFETFLADYFGS